MRFQNAFLAGNQVIGIVFHKGGTLCIRCSCSHDLHQSHHSRRLPVAFSAEAVALLHQSLDCQSGKLLQAAQHAEMGNDCLIVAVLQEPLKADLDSGLLRHMSLKLFRISSLQKNVVFAVIFLNQRVHITLRHGIHIFHRIVHAVMIDLPAELDLGFHLVAFGYGNVVHVVADTADSDVGGFHHAHSRSHPASQLLLYGRAGPVAHNYLALDSHTGYDMSIFPVAVRGLIFIHEIHVDGIVGNLLVELSVKMTQRLSVLLQAQNPHLGRGEGVHPGDHARALRILVCRVQGSADGSRIDQGRL